MLLRKWQDKVEKDVLTIISDLTTERYHRLSDEILEYMCTKLEELADETSMKGFDVEYNVCM
jgi:ribosomal protein S25